MNIKDQKEFLPIFIVGNSRSGTTLMSRILNNSEIVFTFEELHFFEEMWSSTSNNKSLTPQEAVVLIARLLNIQRNGYLNQKDFQEYSHEAQSIVDKLDAHSLIPSLLFAAFLQHETEQNHKQRPCEQTPRNVLYIQEILEIYPQAKIINMIRDPRDILLSQKRRWKRPFLSTNIPKIQALRYWLNYHPFTISKLWNVNVSTVSKFKDDPRVHTLLFENLVANPKLYVKKICEFVEIPYSDRLLDVPQVGSSNELDQPDKKGIDRNKISGWKNGGLMSTEIYITQKLNDRFMLDYGYPIEKVIPNPFLLIVSLISFPIKLVLALLFNLNRVKNIRESIIRRLG